jgi:hypothetical protein
MSKMLNGEICRKHGITKTLKTTTVAWGEKENLVCPECVMEEREKEKNTEAGLLSEANGVPAWHC